MPQTFSKRLWASIDRYLPSSAEGDVLVAFSGGLDSTVLLHALASGPQSDRRLRAVHVNHQLHADAMLWQAHCERVAADLRVPFSSHVVTVPEIPEEGLESAARHVRHEALRAELRSGEILLTAHHADDQLETVLLALLRGSGVDGLAAMPRVQRFGLGWHVRPMLECTRDEIAVYARECGLAWLDDPSNDNTRFDRNYLRRDVVPKLRARWPSAAHMAVRTAAHLGEAAGLLDEIAAHDFAVAAVSGCLKVSVLRSLDPARRRNLLRYWLHSRGARAPSTRKLAGLEHDMLVADEDRSPCVEWDDIEVRRHRDLLYCLPRMPACDSTETSWSWTSPLTLAAGLGLLRAEIAHGQGLALAKLPQEISIRPRVGGETLRLPGQGHHRELKKLLQEAHVLPWWRDRIPLLFAGNRLIAVADLWIVADYAASGDEEGMCIVWDGRPPIDGVSVARQLLT
ncbi:MAG TPA: tRNA lysidine(34) synthetase TilS [Steroidobacteraceae bacterium]|nr:tRNA lysidine(34) synthetase TilS [Steroidobacteraceae bacterium]